MPDEEFENVCAAIACVVLGDDARWDRKDKDGATKTRDFDIVFPRRCYEALEVSAFTDPVAEANRAARRNQDILKTDTLSRTWVVMAPKSAPVKGLLAAVEPALAAFERRGQFEFHASDQWRLRIELGPNNEVAKAATTLVDRKVMSAQSYAPVGDEEASVRLFTPSGGVVDPEDINRAVVDRCQEDNVAKLASADGAAARHLFVPIRMRVPLTHAAAIYGPPASTPTIPDLITRAWVFALRPEVMWFAHGSAWQRTTFDSRDLEAPERWRA